MTDPQPVAWRYVPSEVWRDRVLTEDATLAEMARMNGRDVEPLVLGNEAAAALDALREENERLARLVYVPGLTKCAKCSCALISSVMLAETGAMRADNTAQDCPNGCGPMWRVTERDAGNDAIDRLDAATDKLKAAERARDELLAALTTLHAKCDAMMATIGHRGTISTGDGCVHDVMDAMYATDALIAKHKEST